MTRPLRDDGPTYDAALDAEVVDVPLPDEAEECDRCPEPVNPDARCTHGRSLCPECLTSCPECRDEFADDAGLDWDR